MIGTTIARSPAALVTGDQGAIAMMFAVCASLMIGSMCTALDAIDYEMTQSRMQMALDVATISAGVDLAHYANPTTSDLAAWQADARQFYNANMPTGYLGLAMPDSNFVATVSGVPSTGQTINLSASGSIPLLAPIIFGNGTSSGSGGSGGSGSGSGSSPSNVSTVAASNSALRLPQSTLELALVLDNTGSMADYASSSHSSGTKIQGLRSAATTLVNNIFGQSGNQSYVGLVPFTTMVNVGGALNAGGGWMTPSFSKYNATNLSIAPVKAYPGSGWGGCAVEPHDASNNMYPLAYAPINHPGFTPFYYNVPPTGFTVTTFSKGTTSSTKNNSCYTASPSTVAGVPLTYQTNGSITYCSTVSASPIYDAWGQPNSSSSTITWDQNGSDDVSGARPCSIQPVKFLTQDSTSLLTAISNMQANGSTIIPTGLLWGWRMLSSDWSNAVSNGNGWNSTDANLPRLESTQGLQRVVIVLTDGENDPGTATGIMPSPSFNGLSAIGSSLLRAPTVTGSNGSPLLNGSMSSVTDINSFQAAVCTAMKNSGITIYSITFGTYGTDSASVSAQTTMQNCASPGDYYHAPDNPTLTAIFQQIASNLGILRLTQ